MVALMIGVVKAASAYYWESGGPTQGSTPEADEEILS